LRIKTCLPLRRGTVPALVEQKNKTTKNRSSWQSVAWIVHGMVKIHGPWGYFFFVVAFFAFFAGAFFFAAMLSPPSLWSWDRFNRLIPGTGSIRANFYDYKC
jgi:hypothetical protein